MDGGEDAPAVGQAQGGGGGWFVEDAFQLVADAVAGDGVEGVVGQGLAQGREGVGGQGEVEAGGVAGGAEDAGGVVAEALGVQDADDAGGEVGAAVVGVNDIIGVNYGAGGVRR